MSAGQLVLVILAVLLALGVGLAVGWHYSAKATRRRAALDLQRRMEAVGYVARVQASVIGRQADGARFEFLNHALPGGES